jgi:hypothetical protein
MSVGVFAGLVQRGCRVLVEGVNLGPTLDEMAVI